MRYRIGMKKKFLFKALTLAMTTLFFGGVAPVNQCYASKDLNDENVHQDGKQLTVNMYRKKKPLQDSEETEDFNGEMRIKKKKYHRGPQVGSVKSPMQKQERLPKGVQPTNLYDDNIPLPGNDAPEGESEDDQTVDPNESTLEGRDDDFRDISQVMRSVKGISKLKYSKQNLS